MRYRRDPVDGIRMRTEGRVRRLGSDLAAASVAFSLVFGVGFLLGTWMIPPVDAAHELDMAAGEIPVEDSAPAGEVSLASLRGELADMEPPAALLVAEGVIEGRLVFDRGESLHNVFAVDIGEGEELTMDVNARFTGGDATLTIVSDALARGEVRSEGVSVVLVAQGMTFFSQAGMCTIELQDLGFKTENSIYGQLLVPFFEGHLTCADLSEIRSGELVGLTAVFEFAG